MSSAPPLQAPEPAPVSSALDQPEPVQGQAQARPAAGEGKRSKPEKNAQQAAQLQLKVPKGTKDHAPSAMLLRERIFNTITSVFKLHGAVTIDTPVFELREILAGKYGEDSKLIYDLADQGGEICSLRYDLTVPFARFLAMNHAQYQNIKRYHIAKVYRRDQPAMTKGRMREFYQCDFDVAGTYDAMIPDAEVIEVACSVLDKLDVGPYTIKLNHRKVLDGIFAVCGVPAEKTRTISSAVDKLDKMPWETVRKEMTDEKGLDGAVADKIGEYVKLKGGEDLLTKLLQDSNLTSNASAKAGLDDMVLLFRYLSSYDILSKVSFDLSLARGLDYYTGVIYEAVVEGSAPPPPVPSSLAASENLPTPSKAKSKPKPKDKEGEEEGDESSVGVGSIAAGGRYDELVGMFMNLSSESQKKKGKEKNVQIPCVGISFGVERIYSILEARERANGAPEGRGKKVDVYVMNMGDGLIEERMKLSKELWSAGITAEYTYKSNPKSRPQWSTVERDNIPFVVMIGAGELEAGEVRIKNQFPEAAAEGQEAPADNDKGAVVKREDMVRWLKERLAK